MEDQLWLKVPIKLNIFNMDKELRNDIKKVAKALEKLARLLEKLMKQNG